MPQENLAVFQVPTWNAPHPTAGELSPELRISVCTRLVTLRDTIGKQCCTVFSHLKHQLQLDLSLNSFPRCADTAILERHYSPHWLYIINSLMTNNNQKSSVKINTRFLMRCYICSVWPLRETHYNFCTIGLQCIQYNTVTGLDL